IDVLFGPFIPGAEAMFVDILRFACFADYMHHCSEADRPIKDMTLIAEYIGDVDYINNREHDDCESMMSLLLASDPSKSLVICPDQCGKIARFINGINNFAPFAANQRRSKLRWQVFSANHMVLHQARKNRSQTAIYIPARMEYIVYSILRTRKPLMRNWNVFHIPVE
ncbi:hypothetical protein SSX86_030200, partial [Deinandra increscens subsp. villosa]